MWDCMFLLFLGMSRKRVRTPKSGGISDGKLMFMQERFDTGVCRCLIYSSKIAKKKVKAANWSICWGIRSLAAFWRREQLQAHVGGFIDVEEFAVWYSSFCFAEEARGKTERGREEESICHSVCACARIQACICAYASNLQCSCRFVQFLRLCCAA